MPWFARQRWRAWIETFGALDIVQTLLGSPVSDGGRGLKHYCHVVDGISLQVRPSAMAGVD